MSADGRCRAGAALLGGNGVALIQEMAREKALAQTVQKALENLYQLDRVVDVHDFVTPAEGDDREALLVRESGDGTLELALRLPKLAVRDSSADDALDPLCQIIEGVSHFVYLAEKARSLQQTTQLELEVQAEVDKYVVLAASTKELDERKSARLREQLYERSAYSHADSSEIGMRYRTANDVARSFVTRLERMYIEARSFGAMRRELRRFFRAGQEEKLRSARF